MIISDALDEAAIAFKAGREQAGREMLQQILTRCEPQEAQRFMDQAGVDINVTCLVPEQPTSITKFAGPTPQGFDLPPDRFWGKNSRVH